MRLLAWATLAAAAAVAVWLPACSGESAERPPTRGDTAPRVQPGPWFTVDAAEDRRLEGQAIYHQGPRRPLVSVRRGPVILPLELERVPSRPLLLQAVVSDTGQVARARILRDPAVPGVGASELERRAVDALRTFRFEPAVVGGRPVAVYFDLSVEMRGEPRAD